METSVWVFRCWDYPFRRGDVIRMNGGHKSSYIDHRRRTLKRIVDIFLVMRRGWFSMLGKFRRMGGFRP